MSFRTVNVEPTETPWRYTLKKFTHILAAAAVVAAFVVVPAAGANAATTGEDPNGTFCAAEVQPLGTDEAPADPTCFVTQDDLNAYLQSIGAVSSGGIQARSAAATTVLGTLYQDVNYGGGSLTMWGTGTCSGVTFGWTSMPSGWNDNVSSIIGSSTCWPTAYENSNYGGLKITCTPNCASMSTMNDKTSSMVFKPTGIFG